MYEFIKAIGCHNIALDITYDCNIQCPNCDRYCNNMPGGTESLMTVDQVKKFVLETNDLNHIWKCIKLSGGEAILHPQIIDIVAALKPIFESGKCRNIRILTNGFSPEKIKLLPNWLIVQNSHKEKDFKRISNGGHSKVGILPIDIDMQVDLNNIQCHVMRDFKTGLCSLCLNSWGYYISSPCASVDRIYGFNIGVKSLNEVLSTDYRCIEDQQAVLCRYCGNASATAGIKGELTETYKEVLSAYKLSHKSSSDKLTRY